MFFYFFVISFVENWGGGYCYSEVTLEIRIPHMLLRCFPFICYLRSVQYFNFLRLSILLLQRIFLIVCDHLCFCSFRSYLANILTEISLNTRSRNKPKTNKKNFFLKLHRTATTLNLAECLLAVHSLKTQLGLL